MDPLAQREKAKYEALWAHLPQYREVSPGLEVVTHFFDFFQNEIVSGNRLIDFGCGTGRVAKEFLGKGLLLSLVDLSSNCLDEGVSLLTQLCPEQIRFHEACLWDLPEELLPADWIYCCDVLEHIPEDKIDAVLQGISLRTKKGGYLSISLCEDEMGKTIGEPLHLTVKTRQWWEEKISQHWKIAHSELLFNNLNLGVYLRPL